MRLFRTLIVMVLLAIYSSISVADNFTPLGAILKETHENNDEVAYIYIFKRCGALMGAVAGFTSGDNSAQAKELVETNNKIAEFFIVNALIGSKVTLETRDNIINDLEKMSAVYINNLKQNRLLNANMFVGGDVKQDYAICTAIYNNKRSRK